MLLQLKTCCCEKCDTGLTAETNPTLENITVLFICCRVFLCHFHIELGLSFKVRITKILQEYF